MRLQNVRLSEWSIELVLKTSKGNTFEGSNPSAYATMLNKSIVKLTTVKSHCQSHMAMTLMVDINNKQDGRDEDLDENVM